MNLGDIDLLSDPQTSDLIRFVDLHSLAEIETNAAFVDSMFAWRHTGSEIDDMLLARIISKFETQFRLDAKQRGKIAQTLREGNMRLPALVSYIKQAQQHREAEAPPVVRRPNLTGGQASTASWSHRGEGALPLPAPAPAAAPPPAAVGTGPPKPVSFSINTPERPTSLHLRGSLNRATSEPPPGITDPSEPSAPADDVISLPGVPDHDEQPLLPIPKLTIARSPPYSTRLDH